MDDVRRVKYRCSNRKCGAEDTVKLFEHERIPPVVGCWQCRSGFGMQIDQMVATTSGMFPVPPEEQIEQPVAQPS